MTWDDAGHRVAAIEPGRIRSRYPRVVGRNAWLGRHGEGEEREVVVVTTDRGARGWALPNGPTDGLRALVGRPVAELIDPVIGVLDPAAMPLDLALHDLAARMLGTPVWRMLGARGGDTVEVYSGGIYFDDLDPEDAPAGLDAVRRNLAQDFDAGYRAFKLKIGRGHRWMGSQEGLARDIEVTRLTRETYPDARILVDANDGFTLNDARAYLEAVGDCGLYWLEEPFAERADDLAALRETIARVSPATLIADGEYRPDVPQVLSFAERGLLDVALMDVVDFGVTAWRRTMPALVASGTAGSPHAWGEPVKTYYAAQVAAGLGNVPIIEGVPGTTDGVDAGAYAFADGVLRLPEEPGFALELTSIG